MYTGGFVKGAFVGMILCASICIAVHPKKKLLCKRSGIGKSIRVLGEIVDNIVDVMH